MNNADKLADRKPGFYWCRHKARTEIEPFQWNRLLYWTAIDSRNHFSDDDFDYIGEMIEPPSEETPTSFDEVQDSFNKWQHKQTTAYAFPGKFMGFIAGNEELIHTQGLTKRELIAAMAMQGILSNEDLRMKMIDDQYIDGTTSDNYIAVYATKQADELLKQLEQTKP